MVFLSENFAMLVSINNYTSGSAYCHYLSFISTTLFYLFEIPGVKSKLSNEKW